MKKTITTLAPAGLISVCVIALCVQVRAETAPATQSVSMTRYASRVLIWPAIPHTPNSDEVMRAIQGMAIRKGQTVLGVSPDDLKDFLTETSQFIRVSSPGATPTTDFFGSRENQLTLTVVVPPPVPPRAKEWLDAVVAALPQTVGPLFDKASSQPLQAAHRAVDEAHARYDAASAKLQDLRNKIRSLAGREDVSPKSISDDVASLENQKQSLELDLAGKDARRDALTTEIAKQSNAVQAKVQQDAIANQLQKVVDALQQKVQFEQQAYKKGLANQAAVNDAVAAAADSEAKLLQRRHDAAAEAGGDALDSFNRELLTLSVDLREIQAKLDFINKRLSALSSANDQIDSLTRAQDQASSAGNAVDNAEKALRDLEQQLEGRPTGLILTDSTNLPEPPH